MFRGSLLEKYQFKWSKNLQTWSGYIVATPWMRHFTFFYYLRKSQVCWFVPFVYLFVCLSVVHFTATLFIVLRSNLHSSLEMLIERSLSKMNKIGIISCIQLQKNCFPIIRKFPIHIFSRFSNFNISKTIWGMHAKNWI